MPTEMKENNYSCEDSQLQEIHKALMQEFDAVSKKQFEQKIRLSNGLFQQQLSESYLYRFDTPKEPERVPEADKPHVLSIDGNIVEGSIYAITQEYIEIELKSYYGKVLPSLDIVIDLRILLDLIDRRIVLLDKVPSDFNIATAKFLFNPVSSQNVSSLQTTQDHENRDDNKGLNEQQIQAIHHSLERKLSIIWGPPGTGKTKTLQGVIAELLANNCNVLFASNTNKAIDNLLSDFVNSPGPYAVFNQLKQDGKIVRIGSQTDPDVKETFSPKAVAEQKSKQISDQIQALEQELEKYQGQVAPLESELREHEMALKLQENLNNLHEQLAGIPHLRN